MDTKLKGSSTNTYGYDNRTKNPATRADKIGAESGSGNGECQGSGCNFRFEIKAAGDVNINNYCTPDKNGNAMPPPGDHCFPPYEACLPVIPGAKQKQSRKYKLSSLANRVRVPSAIAACTLHAARRFLLGKDADNPLEAALFSTFGKMSPGILSCTVSAFDSMLPHERTQLFAQSLVLDPNDAIDEEMLTNALSKEILQHVGLNVFGNINAAEEERPGLIRVFPPSPEDFFSQVRICTVNGLRTANFIPAISPGDYLPDEIQQDCEPKLVDGQMQVVCQVRTSDCPGNVLTDFCPRVPEIAAGDGVILEGVNYFSVDARVRFTDKETGTVAREVETHVFGDVDTPTTEVVNGETRLINDCRVHDRLTFQVPVDLNAAIYQIQVVVPNVTNISALGSEIVSNAEFINVIPPPTARFQVVTERIIARKETSPAWFGSDEVGLHTLAFPIDTNGQPINPLQEQKFLDIQDVDFDSGTHRDITRIVFQHNQPILGMLLVVLGDEIDSQRFYDKEVTSQTDFFIDLVKKEAAAIAAVIGALKAAGVTLASLGTPALIFASIVIVILIGIDIIAALWAPADPIIRDAIGLSATDLFQLTDADFPSPDERSFEAADGIKVIVNGTIPPIKLPLEYHETREYVSDDEDSRYEITYRYNRVA